MLEPHIAPPACGTEDAFAALMEISKRPPVLFVEGHGSWLTDQEGKKYLDFIQGWAVNCLGHCPTAIVSAIKSQAEQLLNCSPAFYNAPMIRLAELIARYSGLHRTFFTNSGAEAIEGAIKLAPNGDRSIAVGPTRSSLCITVSTAAQVKPRLRARSPK